MISDRKIVVVMPAYNAARTLARTYEGIPHGYVDEVILVDDASADNTVQRARELGVRVFIHPENRGYGANQKTCHREALALGADVVVMLHPAYQYTPSLIVPMASMITSGVYDVVLASHILTGGARKGGMPLYKYIGNRVLTLFQNLVMGLKLS